MRIQQVYALSSKWFLISIFALLVGSCSSLSSPKPPELGTGLVFPGGGNQISLGGFWYNVEGSGVPQADRVAQTQDPIGGYLFLYWVDDMGNVCHGQPGVSGQPGAVYVSAFRQQAFDLSSQGAVITPTEMQDFQKIPYRTDAYTANGQVSGLHFVQYGNVMWRNRSSGSTSQFRDFIHFSVPLSISVDTTNTLFPYFPDMQQACSKNMGIPLPSFPGTPSGQNPTMCGTRAFPATASMSYRDSLGYCLINLPQGLNWTAVP